METKLHAFSVRVYAIIVNQQNEVLVAEEYHFDQFMCKFPGGGLEFGEGTIACLEREAIEEMGQSITVGQHFYTTDYCQPITVRPGYQLISIYYRANLVGKPSFPLNNYAYQHTKATNGSVTFRWQPISSLKADLFTFPTDQRVAEMLLSEMAEPL